jgi:lantibiotic modifying enzyme
MLLFDKNRHVSLDNKLWDPIKAQNFIVELFDETELVYSSKQFWPAHYDDVGNYGKNPLMDLFLDALKTPSRYDQAGKFSLMDLYMGAAGVVWGLKGLESNTYGIVKNNYLEMLDLAENYQKLAMNSFLEKANFDNNEEYELGLLLGELGFIVAKLKYTRNSSLIQSLVSILEKNIDNSICEYMWGSSGALAVLLAYADVIDSQVLLRLINNTLYTLENQLMDSSAFGCKIWIQNLYGSQVGCLGAVHGFAGNAHSIIKSYKYLERQTRERWSNLFRNTIRKTALKENLLANWPQSIEGDRPGRDQSLVQFCHGAPGIICCFSDLIDGSDPEFDRLMYQAGELVYAAGPLEKGANLCHGTSGNGFAFLKLFTATGNELWLERAREFAMYAIEQSNQKYQKYNQRHYSLWTGDIGLAFYLDACIKGNSEIPTFDTF